jgi:PAS domain S-box-containing protein
VDSPLRILYLENDVADAELVQDMLMTDGVACDAIRVETEAAFRAMLQQGGFDLILADYSLPSFDGFSALTIALEQCPNVPFIFVSGTMGEEVAIEALKIGATDYVLKTRLSRLVPAVRRALRERSAKAELRRSEEALRRSEAYLTIAQSLSHTGSFGWSVSSGEILWSRETYRIFELDLAAQPTLDFILQRVHPDDRSRLSEILDRLAVDRSDFQVEHRLLMPDGRVKYLRVSGRAAHDSSSETDFVGAVTDISAMKQAEHELQKREAKIRRLVDANVVGVLISDLEGPIIEANDAFLHMLGYSRDDLTSGRLRWRDLTPPEWQIVSQRAADQVRATGSCELFEKEYFRSDGTRVPVLVAAAAIDGTQTESVAFVLDLTERKRAEAERERLQQLEADLARMNRVSMMGELAASLAHEIKQPIGAAVIEANTSLRWLRREPPCIGQACEAVSRIVHDVTRAADILDRNRSLYGRGTPKRELVELNELIREMIALLYDKANQYSISIGAELDTTLPAVRADRVQLQQVLMNLMLNGIEAMANTTGELTITSKMTEDGQLLVSVIDSGIGLPGVESERIFEAFFTTKPQGTGVGLSVSRTIIESHGGRLWATANPKRGAAFHFTLPHAATQSLPAAV